MNIGIVYPSLRAVGGAENVVTGLAESLAQRGHRVVLFTSEFSEDVWGPSGRRGFAVERLNLKRRRSTLAANRDAGAALRTALAAHALDVVNPHNYPASLWVHYAREGNASFPRTLLFLHNLTRNFYGPLIDEHFRRLPGLRNVWNRYRPKRVLRLARQAMLGYRRLDQAAVRSCDRVAANSSYTARLAERIYGIPVAACPLGVSLERFHGATPDDGPSEPAGARVPCILAVARIEVQKNFDTLLRAVRTLRDRRPERPFRVTIAGGGPQLDHFRRKSLRMGLGDVVEFLGSVPHERIGGVYAAADFLVHIPLDEPFGLVPVEAALFGKPAIVSDHGGPAEIVVHGETGLHVDSLDHRKVAASIEELLNHPEQARRMGAAARERVMRHFTWDRFVGFYEDFLSEVRSKL